MDGDCTVSREDAVAQQDDLVIRLVMTDPEIANARAHALRNAKQAPTLRIAERLAPGALSRAGVARLMAAVKGESEARVKAEEFEYHVSITTETALLFADLGPNEWIVRDWRSGGARVRTLPSGSDLPGKALAQALGDRTEIAEWVASDIADPRTLRYIDHELGWRTHTPERLKIETRRLLTQPFTLYKASTSGGAVGASYYRKAHGYETDMLKVTVLKLSDGDVRSAVQAEHGGSSMTDTDKSWTSSMWAPAPLHRARARRISKWHSDARR